MINWTINYIKLTYYFFYMRKQKLQIRDKKRWKKAFFNYLCNVSEKSYDYPVRWNVVKGFTKSDIRIVKRAQNVGYEEAPILICVILNELERMEKFLDHYRKIGIKKFAILDNGSTDGTSKYLRRQKDVELFRTKDVFESRVKMGWINRIIAYYGDENWYVVVDADELLVWQGVEDTSIQGVINYLDKIKITRARALMVDMYPKDACWSKEGAFSEIYSKCRYFDYDTYYHKNREEVYLLCGGPRKRKLGLEVWLTKYPLFRLRENEIISNPHTIYPYSNKRTLCFFAVLHYKFLTGSDRIKMQKYVRQGNYAGGSKEYKLYMRKLKENRNNFNFYYEQSAEYQSSRSLGIIKEIVKIPYETEAQ